MWRRVFGLIFGITTVLLLVAVGLVQNETISIWWLVVIGVVGMGVVGWCAEQKYVRPINHLTKTINRLDSGDLNARCLPVTNDEMGTLLRAFNQMSNTQTDRLSILQDERALFLTVFAQMSDAAIVTNKNGAVTVVNDAAVRLFGLDAADVVGRSVGQAVHHHEIIELWRQCAEQNEVQSMIVDVRNGGLFLQVNIIPLTGALDGFIIIVSDLTRVQRLETVRRDFISNVSHELKTPLAALSAIIETLRDGVDDKKVAKKFLKKAGKQVDTMTQMVGELLELSRIESGRVPFKFELRPLLPIIESAFDQMSKPIERKELDVAVDIPADLPYVWVDPVRIERVVTNLLHNAIKFTPDEGKIVVSAVADEKQIKVEVVDTGMGIASEELPRIFERFYKSDRARNSKGTGLGLSIAKHIVQAHRGEIWAESREGSGSTFCFTLPVYDSSERESEQ